MAKRIKRRELEAIQRELTKMAQNDLSSINTKNLSASTEKLLEEIRKNIQNSQIQLMENEAKTKLTVAGVTHDLKTPIAVILGAIECVKDGMEDKDYLSLIQEKAEAMNSMVLQIAEVTQKETQAILNKKIPTETRTYFRAEFSRHKGLLDSKNIKLKLGHIPIVNVVIDKQKISRVIQNLISNAVKYSGKNSVIKVRFHVFGKRIFVTVIDNGIGISEENIPYVFDKFYMEDKSRKSGTGLGLYVAKEILEDHGGTISVKSVAGKGSEFKFMLPMQRNESRWIERYDSRTMALKIWLSLCFGYIWCWGFRFTRYIKTRCASTLFGAIFSLILCPLMWWVDFISLIVYKKLIFLSE